MGWFLLAFALIAILLGGVAVHYYVQYAQCPAKKWRNRVFDLLAQASARVRRESAVLKHLASDYDRQRATLRQQSFTAYLKSIPVRQLDNYPGIGPATIEKLQHAGFTDLASLENARVKVPGLGAKRLTDINAACQQLLKDAASRFDAGACAEAHTFTQQLELLTARYHTALLPAEARVRAAQKAITSLQPLVKSARQVTFLHYLQGTLDTLVPTEMREMRFPDLEEMTPPVPPMARIVDNETIPSHAKARVDVEINGTLQGNNAPVSPAHGDADEYRTILEIGSGVPLSVDLVQRQLHLLTEQNRKAASAGGEYQNIATRRQEAIERAAKALLESCGATLPPPLPAGAAKQELRPNRDLDNVFGV